MLGDLSVGFIFYAILWSLHKAHWPIRLTAAAEIIAVGEKTDVIEVIAQVYGLFHHMQLDLIIMIDSNDLHTTLTTEIQTIYRQICANVGVICFNVEVRYAYVIIWISVKLNPADVGTKFGTSLIAATLCLCCAKWWVWHIPPFSKSI